MVLFAERHGLSNADPPEIFQEGNREIVIWVRCLNWKKHVWVFQKCRRPRTTLDHMDLRFSGSAICGFSHSLAGTTSKGLERAGNDEATIGFLSLFAHPLVFPNPLFLSGVLFP